MRCEAAQRELSASMHDPAPAPRDVAEHVRSCPACSRFSRELHRVHQLARIEPAPPVPDLTPRIMAAVREDAGTVVPLRHRRRGPAAPIARRSIAAAVAAGLVIGFVIGQGGLFGDGGESTALAGEIPKRLVGAAIDLRGYHAVFRVTERNWSPRVPVRTFRTEVWFRAPERFRVAVHDTTTYPSAAWPRNDLELVADRSRWREHGPNPCPPAELPACHPDAIDRTVRNRAPFDSQTQMPTDVIVPMTVLAAVHRVHLLGPGTVDGRAAEAVSLSFADATPLLSSMQFLGSWRPFFPQDRVVVWLDRDTWFPLRYEVIPAAGAERKLWAAQFGVQGDRADVPVFTAEVQSLSTGVPPASAFSVPDAGGADAVDEGFHPGESAGSVALPASSGLRPARAGRFEPATARPYREQLAAYSSGLAWATVARVTGWRERHLFGVGDFAQQVAVGGGVGYYEPATATEARRVALHTDRGEFLVASNLPQARLLAIASMLRVRGVPAPDSWLVRRWSGGVIRNGVELETAARLVPFPVLVPRSVPSGYRSAPAQLVRTPRVRAVTLVYRRPAAELDGVGLRLYQSSDAEIPPPQSVAEEAVTVRGVVGRWSADAHLLEWVEDGVYRSLSSPAFELSTILEVARSLQPIASA